MFIVLNLTREIIVTGKVSFITMYVSDKYRVSYSVA